MAKSSIADKLAFAAKYPPRKKKTAAAKAKTGARTPPSTQKIKRGAMKNASRRTLPIAAPRREDTTKKRRVGFTHNDKVKQCYDLHVKWERIHGVKEENKDEVTYGDLLLEVASMAVIIGDYSEATAMLPLEHEHVLELEELLRDPNQWNWVMQTFKLTDTGDKGGLQNEMYKCLKREWKKFQGAYRTGEETTTVFSNKAVTLISFDDWSPDLSKIANIARAVWIVNSHLEKNEAVELVKTLVAERIKTKADCKRFIPNLIKEYRVKQAKGSLDVMKFELAGGYFANPERANTVIIEVAAHLGNTKAPVKNPRITFNNIKKWVAALPAGKDLDEYAWFSGLTMPETDDERVLRLRKEEMAKNKKKQAKKSKVQPAASETDHGAGQDDSQQENPKPGKEDDPKGNPTENEELEQADSQQENPKPGKKDDSKGKPTEDKELEEGEISDDKRIEEEELEEGNIREGKSKSVEKEGLKEGKSKAVEEVDPNEHKKKELEDGDTREDPENEEEPDTGEKEAPTREKEVVAKPMPQKKHVDFKTIVIVDLTEVEDEIKVATIRRAKQVSKGTAKYRGPTQKLSSSAKYEKSSSKPWVEEKTFKFQLIMKFVNDLLLPEYKLTIDNIKTLKAAIRNERAEKATRLLGFLPPDKNKGIAHVQQSIETWLPGPMVAAFIPYMATLEGVIGSSVPPARLEVNYMAALSLVGNRGYNEFEQEALKTIIREITQQEE